MTVESNAFGRTSDGEVTRYTLRNAGGSIAKLITFGARLTELHVPACGGERGNVVLGFDQLDPYLSDPAYFGCTVGRFANRIAGGRFTLDGQQYQISQNESGNSLHGGRHGFDKKLWSAEPSGETSVRFRYVSRDGEEGFPGELVVQVVYTLTDADELRIAYSATTDRPTVINLTNHSYFNLRGPGSGDVLDHVLTLAADQFTPVNDALIPTGEVRGLRGTSLDFTSPHRIGGRIAQLPGGYDHNFVLSGGGTMSRPCARVEEPTSGRVMEVLTSEPGVQFYTGNFLDGSIRGAGGAFARHGGFCLEAQHFPDSPNHPAFPSTVLRPGEQYQQTTIYRFKTE